MRDEGENFESKEGYFIQLEELSSGEILLLELGEMLPEGHVFLYKRLKVCSVNGLFSYKNSKI
jgi:hypothetical protein